MMTTTKLTTDNKQKATSKTACDARGQKSPPKIGISCPTCNIELC